VGGEAVVSGGRKVDAEEHDRRGAGGVSNHFDTSQPSHRHQPDFYRPPMVTPPPGGGGNTGGVTDLSRGTDTHDFSDQMHFLGPRLATDP